MHTWTALILLKDQVFEATPYVVNKWVGEE